MRIKIALTCVFLVVFSFGCQRGDPNAPMQPDMAKSMIKLKGYNADEAGLLSAIRMNDVVILKAFFDAGVNPNAQNESGETVLTFAIQNAEMKTVKLLLEKADINLKDKKGNSPIHLALLLNKDEVFNKMLEKNADVNVGGRDKKLENQTVLYLAVYRQDEALVKKLLDKGANPNQADGDGSIPLVEAVVGGAVNIEIVKMLLDKAANPNTQEQNGATPLIHIAGNKNISAAKRQEIIKMLLEKGADKTIKDKKGRTPLDVAKQFGNKDVFDLLK